MVSAARIERRIEPLDLVLLRIDDPTVVTAGAVFTARDPFPGSPGFAIDYVATPAWPILHSGFIGKPDSSAELTKLGIEIPAGAQGGPVFDSGGRVIGIALRGTDRQDCLLTVSALRREFGELLGSMADQAAT
jgi:hypothetical protein